MFLIQLKYKDMIKFKTLLILNKIISYKNNFFLENINNQIKH